MRVNLAAQVKWSVHQFACMMQYSLQLTWSFIIQVLSKSVAEAFKYYGEADTVETEIFVRNFDRFFDMLNTRCLEEEIYKKKPDLQAYKKVDDERFKAVI